MYEMCLIKRNEDEGEGKLALEEATKARGGGISRCITLLFL